MQGLFNYLSRHQNLLALNVKRRSIPARVIRPQDLTLEAENIKALKLICLVSGSKLIEGHCGPVELHFILIIILA